MDGSQLDHDVPSFLRSIGKWGGQIGVLCGAGISVPSGVPAADGLLKKIISDIGGDELKGADGKALKLSDFLGSSGARLPHKVPLRFEGFMEVVQRIADPELELLDHIYFGAGDYQPEACTMHRLLGELSARVPVVTTNIDVLIERSANVKPCFSMPVPEPRLWKIHGTTRAFERGEWAISEKQRPVATLRSLARTRNDRERRSQFADFLADRAVVIIGYSASDDFDISEWLGHARCGTIYWVTYADSEPGFEALRLRLQQNTATPIEHLPLRGARHEKNAALLELVRGLLGGASDGQEPPGPSNTSQSWSAPAARWLDKHVPASGLRRRLLLAELLKHVARFHAALEVLGPICGEDFAATSDDIALAHLLSAEALVEIGRRDGRRRAAGHAAAAVGYFSGVKKCAGEYAAARLVDAAICRIEEDVVGYERAGNELLEMTRDGSLEPALRARCAAELYRLAVRHWGNSPEELRIAARAAIDDARLHDLYAEGLAQHELSKQALLLRRINGALSDDWCRSPADAIEGLESLREAQHLRWLVGELKGYCASGNVLVESFTALADWYDALGDAESSTKMIHEAWKSLDTPLEVAVEHDLSFERVACFQSKIHLSLRFDSGYEAMTAANIRQVIDEVIADSGEGKIDYCRAKFYGVLHAIKCRESLEAALTCCAEQFFVLERATRENASGRADVRYLAYRAGMNSSYAHLLQGKIELDEFKSSYPPGVEERPIWRDLIKRMLERRERITTVPQLLAVLLPPLPGMHAGRFKAPKQATV